MKKKKKRIASSIGFVKYSFSNVIYSSGVFINKLLQNNNNNSIVASETFY